MALPLGDGGKEPVKIGDDAVMHRILSDNRIVWLKGSSGTLYISDAAGNTQEIASNVENFPFFVNAAETHVLWVERGSTQMSMRTLDLSGENCSVKLEQSGIHVCGSSDADRQQGWKSLYP